MGGLSMWHWLIIVAVFLLLFGAKRLPDAARGVGRSMRILKSEVGQMSKENAAKAAAPAGARVDLNGSTIGPIDIPQTITRPEPIRVSSDGHRSA